MKKIKELCIKYREIIVYLIVGVANTIFCWVLCWIFEHFIFDANDPFQNFLINTLDWVAGVLFAFPLNRKWVFKSKNPQVFKELIGFAGSRLTTWALDVLIMWLFVNVWPLTNFVTKLFGYWLDKFCIDHDTANFWFVKILISSVLVMIANYCFSKLLVFRNKKDDNEVKDN